MMQTRGVGWRRLRFRFDWTLTLAAAAVATLGLKIGRAHV